MSSLVNILLILLVVLCAVQWISIAVACVRRLAWSRSRNVERPGVTILKPVCGIENNLHQTLQSSFEIDYPQYELIICAATRTDPVVPLVEKMVARYPQVDARLLIGDERISQNPKLNNLWKGWQAAKYDRIVISDSNVLSPSTYLDDLNECWSPRTSFVCSPPVGVDADGAAAALEVAFLNTYQARWQLVADFFGQGYVQGKTMSLSRADLERQGGLCALGQELAEDAAATKVARRIGGSVKLVRNPFPQPLGKRSFSQVWARQLRWAQLRRSSFPWAYSVEILTGAAPPAALYCALAYMGVVPWLGLLALLSCWYLPEAVLAKIYRWPMCITSPIAWILRDLLGPILWVQGWLSRGFIWHGTKIFEAESAIK